MQVVRLTSYNPFENMFKEFLVQQQYLLTMQLQRKEKTNNKGCRQQKLDLQLIDEKYYSYQNCPEAYMLQIIKQFNPWQNKSHDHILDFLKSISLLYKPNPYHNITHAFDVMVHLDRYLIDYRFQEKLHISHHNRVFMLITAYAHDCGHQGLTNAYYKNSHNQLALLGNSPLEQMHISQFRRLLREYDLEIPKMTLKVLTQMILKTDNFYHNQLVSKMSELQGSSEDILREKSSLVTISCVLLHLADLNNTSKPLQLNVRWTMLLYQEFMEQDKLQQEKGIDLTCVPFTTSLKQSQSNIYFLNHLVLPLYRAITNFQAKFGQLIGQVSLNLQYWHKRVELQSPSQ